MIYFIRSGDSIKIGFTDDPQTRFSDLQVASPSRLEVLLLIDGSKTLERTLHNKFKSIHIRGEWFKLNDQILDYINDISAFDRRYEFGFMEPDFQGNDQLRRIRIRSKTTMKEVADILELSIPTIQGSEENERKGTITINQLSKIAGAMGFKLEYRLVLNEAGKKIKDDAAKEAAISMSLKIHTRAC